jgi:hypothetical protein
MADETEAAHERFITENQRLVEAAHQRLDELEQRSSKDSRIAWALLAARRWLGRTAFRWAVLVTAFALFLASVIRPDWIRVILAISYALFTVALVYWKEER